MSVNSSAAIIGAIALAGVAGTVSYVIATRPASEPAPVEQEASTAPAYTASAPRNSSSAAPAAYAPSQEYSDVSPTAQQIVVDTPPPPLPVYEIPPPPAPDYTWTPGYWGYADSGFIWIAGSWMRPPRPNAYWTPGYWGYEGGRYAWHHGYWGPHVGFYGGVPYGGGYDGHGYHGGEWHGDHFEANRAIINARIDGNIVSYNGGPHGMRAEPTPEQRRAMEEQHFAMPNAQHEHAHDDNHPSEFRENVNRPNPSMNVVEHPGEVRHEEHEEHPQILRPANEPEHRAEAPMARPAAPAIVQAVPEQRLAAPVHIERAAEAPHTEAPREIHEMHAAESAHVAGVPAAHEEHPHPEEAPKPAAPHEPPHEQPHPEAAHGDAHEGEEGGHEH